MKRDFTGNAVSFSDLAGVRQIPVAAQIRFGPKQNRKLALTEKALSGLR
jgi:hypothetical protein